jgi:hypothetical protein
MVSGLAAVVALASCAPAKGPAGPPDSYLVVERAATDAEAGAAGLPSLKPLDVGDTRAVPVHRGAAEWTAGCTAASDGAAASGCVNSVTSTSSRRSQLVTKGTPRSGCAQGLLLP